MSPVFDVFCVDDSITAGRLAGGPTGDLRLYPDLDRVVRLAAQPGWAWAPVDRFTQDGDEHPGCQRSFARRMASEAAAAGLDIRMGFEIEWALGVDGPGQFLPACSGPAYGMTRMVELSDYCRDLMVALTAESVEVLQLHPEYAAGQFEVSTAPLDPVVRPTTCCWSARPFGRYPGSTGWPLRSRPRSSRVWSATASTCISRCTAMATCWPAGPVLWHDRGGGVVPGRRTRRAACPVRSRRAERRQPRAAGALALGRRLPVLGPGESRGRASTRDRVDGREKHGGQCRGEVLRRQRQPLPRGRRGTVGPPGVRGQGAAAAAGGDR